MDEYFSVISMFLSLYDFSLKASKTTFNTIFTLNILFLLNICLILLGLFLNFLLFFCDFSVIVFVFFFGDGQWTA